jgi:hypothetical protein
MGSLLTPNRDEDPESPCTNPENSTGTEPTEVSFALSILFDGSQVFFGLAPL